MLDHVKSLPVDVSFEEAEISEVTGVPKMFVRRFLNGVAGIDQEILNFGEPDGKVCRRGPVETGSRLA